MFCLRVGCPKSKSITLFRMILHTSIVSVEAPFSLKVVHTASRYRVGRCPPGEAAGVRVAMISRHRLR
jgi:hypothetical protein